MLRICKPERNKVSTDKGIKGTPPLEEIEHGSVMEACQDE